ncbi:MAG: YeeE/YedE thiosulfate transporter family protein, partial [Pseudohongiellaceae bacterium]
GAIALQWIVLAGLWWLVGRREKRMTGKTSHGLLERDRTVSVVRTLLTGRWPFLWAAVVLAVGNLLTVILSGTPWGVTFAFALWGAKIAQFIGIDMTQVEFWTWDYGALALRDSLLVNVPSVMNFGLLLGAMLAAGMANKYNAGSQNPLVLRS